ncbi:MAG: TraB/GumN family protein [Treponema sp.]|nr:TraB/GumN family protein [Treponema sp.]
MFIRKKFCKALAIFFAAAFVFCTNSLAKESVSTAKASSGQNASVQKATLTKEKPRMFWKISGVDKNGNPSFVYIQGTIHIGSKELYPLDKEVLDAFNNADIIAGEISSEDMSKIQLYSMRLIQESFIKAGGKKISENLSPKEVESLKTLLGGPLNFNVVDGAEPWVLSLALLGKTVQETTELTAEYSLDSYFLKLANDSSRKVAGLDDLKAQFDILTFGTYEQQIMILKSSIKECSEEDSIQETKAELDNLYNAYLSDDLEKLASISQNSNERDVSEYGDFGEEYQELVYDKRNEDWAKDIKEFLENGGSTFIYAGAAHWVGKNSVFEYLRKQGTIE